MRLNLRALLRLSVFALMSTVIAASVSGCSPHGDAVISNKLSLNQGGSRDVAKAIQGLNVVDEDGKAIAGAQILIGTKLNAPFAGNFVTTDGTGHIDLPAAWTDAEPLTVAAKGFVRATFFGRMPGDTTLTIRHSAMGPEKFELSGETTGYGDIKDGIVEVGIMLPTFTRGQLSIFDPLSIINSDTDTMEVMGKSIEIPSNIAIPPQQQTYYFPLTFSKPKYRYQFNYPHTYKVSAAHVTIPTQDLVDSVQGGLKVFKLLNKLTFVGGGMGNANVTSENTSLDIPINQTAFSPMVSVTAPKFASNQQMVTVATEENAGIYTVTDAKVLASGESTTLNAPSARGAVIAVLRPIQQHETTTGPQNSIFSAVISNNEGAMTRAPVDFLEAVKPPQVSNANINVIPPKKFHGIEPMMTYALLSKIELIDHGKYKLEKKTPEWELYASDWVANINLPTWPTADFYDDSGDDSNAEPKASSKRWETMFAGQYGANATAILAGPQALEKVTHVTRSAVDL